MIASLVEISNSSAWNRMGTVVVSSWVFFSWNFAFDLWINGRHWTMANGLYSFGDGNINIGIAINFLLSSQYFPCEGQNRKDHLWRDTVQSVLPYPEPGVFAVTQFLVQPLWALGSIFLRQLLWALGSSFHRYSAVVSTRCQFPEILSCCEHWAAVSVGTQLLWALGVSFHRYSALVSTGRQLPQILSFRMMLLFKWSQLQSVSPTEEALCACV